MAQKAPCWDKRNKMWACELCPWNLSRRKQPWEEWIALKERYRRAIFKAGGFILFSSSVSIFKHWEFCHQPNSHFKSKHIKRRKITVQTLAKTKSDREGRSSGDRYCIFWMPRQVEEPILLRQLRRSINHQKSHWKAKQWGAWSEAGNFLFQSHRVLTPQPKALLLWDGALHCSWHRGNCF